MQEMNAADELRMKREVLQSSSVVCTTLNHSGSVLLLDVLKPFNNNGRTTVPLGCVIVDEVLHCSCLAICHPHCSMLMHVVKSVCVYLGSYF